MWADLAHVGLLSSSVKKSLQEEKSLHEQKSPHKQKSFREQKYSFREQSHFMCKSPQFLPYTRSEREWKSRLVAEGMVPGLNH